MELSRRGVEILAQLKGSNCDPRLVSSFSDLQSYLESSENVIQIGLTNIVFDNLRKTFNAELPDAIGAILQSHAVGVSMLVAQYPEWVTFSENANSIELSEQDIKAVSSALQVLVDATEKQPEIASPEVPRTIKAISQIISDPKGTGKRAALAAIRTLENLVIKVFGYGGDLIDKTAHKTIDALSTTTSRVLALAVLSLGLTVAGNLMGISASVDGLGWIKDAVEIVRAQLELLRAT